MSKLASFVDAWSRGEVELAPIAELLGVEPVAVGEGEARLAMAVGERYHNAMGTVHGGIFCDLADVAIGVALATRIEDGEHFSTLQLQMSYFLPVREGRLLATARLVRRGRSTAYLECEIEDGEGRLAAKATSTCVIQQR